MQKKWEKQMQERIFKDMDYRDSVIRALFSTEDGKQVLAWMQNYYSHKTVNTENPNAMYVALGKEEVVRDILRIMNKNKE